MFSVGSVSQLAERFLDGSSMVSSWERHFFPRYVIKMLFSDIPRLVSLLDKWRKIIRKVIHQKLMHQNSILAFYSQSEHTYAPIHTDTDRQTDTHPEGFCLWSDRFHNFKILLNLGKLFQITEAMSSFILSIEETFSSGHFFQSLNLHLSPQRIRSMWTSRMNTVSSRIL